MRKLEDYKAGDLVADVRDSTGEKFVWLLVTTKKSLQWVYVFAGHNSSDNRFACDVYLEHDSFATAFAGRAEHLKYLGNIKDNVDWFKLLQKVESDDDTKSSS